MAAETLKTPKAEARNGTKPALPTMTLDVSKYLPRDAPVVARLSTEQRQLIMDVGGPGWVRKIVQAIAVAG